MNYFKTISKLSILSIICMYNVTDYGMSVDLNTAVSNLDEQAIALALILSKPTESEITQALKSLLVVEKQEEMARLGRKITGAVKVGFGLLAGAVSARFADKVLKDHEDFSIDQNDSYRELLSRLIFGRHTKIANSNALSYVTHGPLTMTAGAVGVLGAWSLKSGISNLIQKDGLDKVKRIRELLESYSKKNINNSLVYLDGANDR